MTTSTELKLLELDKRAWALVEAIDDWGKMRHHMELAQPGMNYDCWYAVGNSLCDIAQSIIEARQRSVWQQGDEYDK